MHGKAACRARQECHGGCEAGGTSRPTAAPALGVGLTGSSLKPTWDCCAVPLCPCLAGWRARCMPQGCW